MSLKKKEECEDEHSVLAIFLCSLFSVPGYDLIYIFFSLDNGILSFYPILYLVAEDHT